MAYSVSVDKHGRLVVPSTVRQKLGFEPGKELVAFSDEKKFVVESKENLVAELQDMFSDVEESVNDFLTEKRRDAVKENEWLKNSL